MIHVPPKPILGRDLPRDFTYIPDGINIHCSTWETASSVVDLQGQRQPGAPGASKPNANFA